MTEKQVQFCLVYLVVTLLSTKTLKYLLYGEIIMKKSQFNFDLPENLIAQTPLDKRDESRLLMLDRYTGQVSHNHFYDIKDLLKEGDLLILNDSRVLPARLYGKRIPTGGKVQFLLLREIKQGYWETLVKPGRKARPGMKFSFGENMTGEIIEIIEGGNRIVKFEYTGNFFEILDEIGEMPLPEYIHETLEDSERYQTVYSKDIGSAAAPTAGLHFTPELLNELSEKGINHAFVTLHVGLGTFRPVKTDKIEDHTMHSEHFTIPQETVDAIKATKAKGGRVIAVGTTACRTLESVMQQQGEIVAISGDTSIFIYPGYEFQILDGLITNFHLPESTLVMLVSAFAGTENVLNAYKIAVENQYRFFSFGDAMLII